jgi:hypothetical protein
MKFSKIALAAVAAAAFAGQAQAATTFLTGASATSNNYVFALKSLCSGNFVVHKTTTATDSLGNFFTAKCSQDFDGLTGVDAVAFNVAGGSYTAVQNSTLGATGVAFVQNTSGTSTVAGTNTLAGVNLVVGVATSGNIKSAGGFLDIEPAAFDADLLAPFGGAEALLDKTEGAQFSQAFGVAVSNSLYTALQAAQGLAGCNGESLTPACQPTVSKAQYATIANAAFNSAKTDINALFGVPAGKLTLCRRASTSGTQAASNQFFLNTFIGQGPNLGASLPATTAAYPASGPDATPTFEVKEGPGTADARNCLNAAGYGIGVLSLENKPSATTGYRFVKLNRVEGYDNAASSKGTAIAGEYEFQFQGAKFTAAGAQTNPVIEAIDAALANIGPTVFGLWGAAESEFNRGGLNTNSLVKN